MNGMSGGSASNWPSVSYFDESTGGARERLADLELVRVKDLNSWATEDHSVAEKSLLLEQRGGESHYLCIWRGCGQRAVRGAAICVDHLYAQGVRK